VKRDDTALADRLTAMMRESNRVFPARKVKGVRSILSKDSSLPGVRADRQFGRRLQACSFDREKGRKPDTALDVRDDGDVGHEYDARLGADRFPTWR
jgi:hypothetical protein